MGFLSLTLTVGAQSGKPYNQIFLQEYFRGILPSARTEAMGKTDVALGGSITGTFNNAASISTIGKLELHLSTSAPYYALHNSNFVYAGFARRITPRIVAGLSVNNFFYGKSPFELNIPPERYPVDRPRMSNVALTGTYEVIQGLSLGVNFNVFNWKNFDDVDATNAFLLDLGVHYTRPISKKSEIRGGLGLSNLTGAEISFFAPDGRSGSNVFPRNLRAGVAYQANVPCKLPGSEIEEVQVTGTAAYHNVLNSDFLQGFSVGTEFVLYRILALRAGYFEYSIDDQGFANNRSKISAVTYGFGIKLPIAALIKKDVPFDTRFDFTSLRHAPYTVSGRRLPNFRNFSLNLNWKEDEE